MCQITFLPLFSRVLVRRTLYLAEMGEVREWKENCRAKSREMKIGVAGPVGGTTTTSRQERQTDQKMGPYNLLLLDCLRSKDMSFPLK